jgi:hypothetical protein
VERQNLALQEPRDSEYKIFIFTEFIVARTGTGRLFLCEALRNRFVSFENLQYRIRLVLSLLLYYFILRFNFTRTGTGTIKKNEIYLPVAPDPHPLNSFFFLCCLDFAVAAFKLCYWNRYR